MAFSLMEQELASIQIAAELASLAIFNFILNSGCTRAAEQCFTKLLKKSLLATTNS